MQCLLVSIEFQISSTDKLDPTSFEKKRNLLQFFPFPSKAHSNVKTKTNMNDALIPIDIIRFFSD